LDRFISGKVWIGLYLERRPVVNETYETYKYNVNVRLCGGGEIMGIVRALKAVY